MTGGLQQQKKRNEPEEVMVKFAQEGSIRPLIGRREGGAGGAERDECPAV